MTARTFSVAALLCLACAGGDPPGPDGGGPNDETPIVDRPWSGTYNCSQERGLTDHSPLSWQLIPPALVPGAKRAQLARIESTGSNPFMQSVPELLLSSFDVGGSFGPPTKVPLASPQEAGGLAGAPRGEGVALVWVDGTKLRFAAFDGAGQTVVPAKDVADGLDRLSAPMLAAGPDGAFGLVYAPPAGDAREVRFAVLDAMGGVRLAPRALTPNPGATFTHPAPAITASAAGYGMAWRDPEGPAGGIDFASADLAGAQVVARHRISAPTAPGVVAGGLAGFEPPTTALLATGGGYLAAWTETQPGRGDSGASSVVRLARLDGNGVRQGPAVAMRAPTKDIDEVEPTLLPYEGTVAVLWGRGSHIYICGGCVPDHSIELVLVDPDDLSPESGVISLRNGGDPRGGGLLRRRVAVQNHSLLITYLLNFHVHATPGSAAFKCEMHVP